MTGQPKRGSPLRKAVGISGGVAIAACAAAIAWLTWPAGAAADDKTDKAADAGTQEAPKAVWCHHTPDHDCITEACGTGKRVITLFDAKWCRYCQRLKKNVLPDPEVQKLLSEFSLIEIDEAENRELVEALKINGYPTWFIHEKGCEKGIDRFSGAPRTAKDFIKRFERYRAP